MEFDLPFVVEINYKTYLIIPLEDETFDVFTSDGKRIGNIFPDVGIDTEITWSTSDLIPLDKVAAIGYAIEKKES
jgi:hypothetical protein